MSNPPTRETRLDRQHDDDGDLDDTVYHVLRSSAKHYHEDPNCKHVSNRDELEPTTRGEAQQKWEAPCSECVM